MKCFIYILRSQKDHQCYVGMTQALERRQREHNEGRVLSTRHRRPLEHIYVEEAESREVARVREKYWKSGAGREKIQRMLKSSFAFNGRPASGQV